MFRFLKITSLSTALISSQFTLTAATPSATPLTWHLTLEQAVAQALTKSPSQRIARSRIDQALARAQQAGLWENPELQLNYVGDQAFSGPGERNFALGFKQKLPLTHRVVLEKGIAHDFIQLAQHEAADESRRLQQQVASSYLKLAESEAQLTLRDELIALYKNFADFVASRIKTGEASQIALNQIKIESAALQEQQHSLQGSRLKHSAKLRQLIGLQPNVKLVLDFEFSVPTQAPNFPRPTAAMLKQHPQYQRQALLCKIAEQQLLLSQQERWADPTLKIFYKEERNRNTSSNWERDRFVGIGLSVPLPLFNNGKAAVAENRARQMQFRAQLQRSQLELSHTAELQRKNVSQLYTQATDYQEQLAKLVEQNLTAMQTAYAAGQIALSDVFRAQEQSLILQAAHLSRLQHYQQAVIDWQSAIAYSPTND
jgi:outer membrane protein, heavy metal efflux system